MKLVEGQTIQGILDHDAQLFCDTEFSNCVFDNAALIPSNPAKRPTIRNMVVNDCAVHSSSIDGAIIEDVVVSNLKRRHVPIFLRANAFRHVMLSGDIAATEIRGGIGVLDDEHNEAWDRANAEFYQDVDWALDIADARFASLSVHGIPATLVRRDEESSAIVTRQAALDGEWREIEYHGGLFFQTISRLVSDGYPDTLLIGCKKSSGFADDMKDLKRLRDLGIAT